MDALITAAAASATTTTTTAVATAVAMAVAVETAAAVFASSTPPTTDWLQQGPSPTAPTAIATTAAEAAAADAGASTSTSAAPRATVTIIETYGSGAILISIHYGSYWFFNKGSQANRAYGRLKIRRSRLNKHELILAPSILHPDDIQIGFKDIGGLDPIVESLKETVIYPLCMPKVFQSTSGYLGAPKGVLLFGPPGCGKTMLAKALAKESGANFLNVPVSSLVNKWLGESEKLVHALFSLAKKIQPVIVFIDEIDSFLKERKQEDHDTTRRIVAEFLSMWDGLAAGGPSQILVLGATNRPKDIDPAFLRRLPKRFPLALPNATQRKQILTLVSRASGPTPLTQIFANQKRFPDLKSNPPRTKLISKLNMDPSFDLDQLVARTEGLSGSDLRELCSNAALAPLREALRALAASAAAASGGEKGTAPTAAAAAASMDKVFRDVDPTTLDLRPVRITDILSDTVTETGKAQGTDWTLGGLDI
ncbi:P-loop containing nucleoside triphosphate hydrolase protein [Zopfochytrium polystomum]|nr:P-loop containing nucleoside triphosphate hydrolase protein [Zopfochytrium polystomum]